MKYPVITSAKAKSDLFKAHTYMTDLKKNIMNHKQNMDMMRANEVAKNEEKNKVDSVNKSKIILERVKKML